MRILGLVEQHPQELPIERLSSSKNEATSTPAALDAAFARRRRSKIKDVMNVVLKH
jgi:hypothetical protein